MAKLFDDGESRDRPGPLADRLRPSDWQDFHGQDELVGRDSTLRRLIDSGELGPTIFWGPPGSGKTTLARIIASKLGVRFRPYSAVLTGIRDVREVMEEAGRDWHAGGRRTLLFIDEIHRFNKAQQDAFLAHVERGEILLIGATTENPSFEIIPALLSRCTVQVLQPLPGPALLRILNRAVTAKTGLAAWNPAIGPAAMEEIAARANGDARRALNLLERIVLAAPPGPDGARRVERDDVLTVLENLPLLYDKGGEEHFNLISALHKSIRNSDADAGLYWLARMLEAGADPLYVARRLVRAASEDVGNADPRALQVAVAAGDAVHFLGLPEGKLALAQAVVYLAAAPKSNSILRAYAEVVEDLRAGRTDPVPLHLRNAPTRLMKTLGYGAGYEYAHDDPEGLTAMECLPPRLHGREYYRPADSGFEKMIRERMRLRKEILDRRRKSGRKRGRTPVNPSRSASR